MGGDFILGDFTLGEFRGASRLVKLWGETLGGKLWGGYTPRRFAPRETLGGELLGALQIDRLQIYRIGFEFVSIVLHTPIGQNAMKHVCELEFPIIEGL